MDGDDKVQTTSKFFSFHDRPNQQQPMNLPSKIQKVSMAASNSSGLESGDNVRHSTDSMRALIQDSAEDFKRTILTWNDTESVLQKTLSNESSRLTASRDHLDRLCQIAEVHQDKLMKEKSALKSRLKKLGEGLQTSDVTSQ